MHPFLEYLLKANLLLVFFVLFYSIFLKKETFYQLNRWYLIGSIIVSAIAPFISFTKTVWVDPIPVEYSINNGENEIINEVAAETNFLKTIDIQQVAVYLMLFISLVLLIKKIYALAKLYHSIKKMPNSGASNIKITLEQKVVYSFYRWIVVPEDFFQWKNHQLILDHERIHLKQKHTFDLMLIEVIAAVFWFNPLVKVMQRHINNNLEYIVDEQMVQKTEPVLYQKSLLQFQVQKNIQFANAYHTSDIKSRILQLNSKKSTRMNRLKLLLAAPVLVGFFVMFQTETVAQIRESKSTIRKSNHEENQQSPNLEKEEAVKESKFEKNEDIFMLLDSVEKDLEVLKNDRKKFEEIASKFLIIVDGILMSKQQLQNFETSRIKSAHIDTSNNEKGTVLYLSTEDSDNDANRKFTFKIANDNNESDYYFKDNNKQNLANSEKLFYKIMIDGKEATEEELQKFYRTAKNFQARNENKVIIIETNIAETNRDKPHTIVKIGNNTLNYIYLLNGKEITDEHFKQINPEDIDQITILKDQKSKEKYAATKKDGVIVVTTKAKKKVSHNQYKQAQQKREALVNKKKELLAERKQKIKERKKEIEKLKQIKKDLETVTSIFNDVKEIKKIENEQFKITKISASITREDGTKVELSEDY